MLIKLEIIISLVLCVHLMLLLVYKCRVKQMQDYRIKSMLDSPIVLSVCNCFQ